MKFTKEEAHKELVSKIPTEGETLNLSERSIDEQLETLMPALANDDTEMSDFITTVLPIFKTADKNVRKDVSDKVKAYKDANPIVVQPAPKVGPTPKKEDDDPMEALRKRIEELEKNNADNEKKITLSQRRSTIATKMNEKGCKDKEWIDSLLDEVNLEGEEFDADARANKYIKMYNKSQAKVNQDVTPKNANGSGSDSYLDSVIKAAVAKKKADEA